MSGPGGSDAARRIAAGVGAVGVAAGLCAGAALTAAPAAAEPPQRLDDQLVDSAGVITDDGEVANALVRLNEEDGVLLYVVIVDSFDGQDSLAWAEETAELSGLGITNPLLAIAVEDREYAVSVDEDFELSDGELADLESDDLVPELADDDWTRGVVAYADGMRGEVGGGGPGIGTAVVLGGGAVVVVGAGVAIARRRRGRAAATAPGAKGAPPVDLDELASRASRLLVATDEAVRTSERELGFAQAEFGEAATQPFGEALVRAKQAVAEGFSVRQRLDDAEPETDDERRRMLEHVLELCERADAELDAQTESFTALRDVSSRLPQLVPALEQRLAAVESAVPSATETLADLSRRFSPSVAEPVAGAPAEVGRRVALAREQLALVGQGGGEAAVAFRTAEEVVAQAEQLLAGVDRTRAEALEAGNGLPRAVSALHADVTAYTASPVASGPAVAEALAAGQAALAYAEQSGRIDPVGALRKVLDADAALDAATADARDAGERAQRAAAALPQALTAAQAQVAAAEDVIATHRGVVGGTARTRAAEAARVLAEAHGTAAQDPVAALAAAQRAAELASSAAAAARSDASRGTGGYGSSTRWAGDDGPRATSGGGLFDLLFSGSGSSDRGWGGSGSSWGGGGSSWGGGSSRRSSSRRRSSGGSSRRSSSRRSSGGGRRGGRGRF